MTYRRINPNPISKGPFIFVRQTALSKAQSNTLTAIAAKTPTRVEPTVVFNAVALDSKRQTNIKADERWSTYPLALVVVAAAEAVVAALVAAAAAEEVPDADLAELEAAEVELAPPAAAAELAIPEAEELAPLAAAELELERCQVENWDAEMTVHLDDPPIAASWNAVYD